MKRFMSIRRLSMLVLSVVAISAVSGCGANCASVSFLDFVNTVLLGITAAGGIVLINNV
ncbi:MAG: hypothetical protein DHS20C16_17790 [Phycisphaerae bacterium]|nr:MAG: hypothetical protein DHS20C16_17790 [Phycisphaerae bacterium]